ncbi:MAG: hypothetical protein ACQEUM_01980 [Pseudomonadota bacterium]
MYLKEDLLLKWMKGNSSAVEFLLMVMKISHVWDDLIDKDKPIEDDDVNKAFFDSLIRLPRNDFYRKNFDHLNSIMMNSISNWHIATNMEREGGELQLNIAFILRSSYVDLITQSALLVGGQAWASKVGKEVRNFTHHEKYSGYLKTLNEEVKARQAVER